MPPQPRGPFRPQSVDTSFPRLAWAPVTAGSYSAWPRGSMSDYACAWYGASVTLDIRRPAPPALSSSTRLNELNGARRYPTLRTCHSSSSSASPLLRSPASLELVGLRV